MDKFLLGRYVEGDSFIHRLDPRTKLLFTFAFITLTFLIQHQSLMSGWMYAVLVAYASVGFLLSSLPFSFFFKGIKPMIWLILFTVSLQFLFTTGGTVYFEWGIIHITSGGLINSVFITIRFVLVIVISTMLTLTTPPLSLTTAIEYLLLPLKKVRFPVHELALMLSIALRFVPTLMDEAQKIMNAQRSRGVEFDEGKLIDRLKSIIPILIPLFVNAFNRAEELAVAMEARGYRNGEGRTKYRILKWKKEDGYVAVSFFAVTCLMLLLRWVG